MRHTRTVVAVLVSAGIVFVIGLPWLFKKYRTPAQYVPDEVATTEDIQEFDLMWTQLESLQEQSAEIGPEQFKQQFLGSTTAFLQLDSDQTENFLNVVDECLARLDKSRNRLTGTRKQNQEQTSKRETSQDSWSGESPESIASQRDAWSDFRDDQRDTSDLVLSVLQPSPRHNLLAERRLLWLLKLDFSLRDAKKGSGAGSGALLAD